MRNAETCAEELEELEELDGKVCAESLEELEELDGKGCASNSYTSRVVISTNYV